MSVSGRFNPAGCFKFLFFFFFFYHKILTIPSDSGRVELVVGKILVRML